MTQDYDPLFAIHSIDYNQYTSALKNTNANGVISGLAVAQRGAGANMSVDVALGEARVDGTRYSFGSTTNLTIGTAHATYPRKDIIVINSSGTLTVRAGTAAAADPDGDTMRLTKSPRPPDITIGDILLAEVWIVENDTAIENAEISDRRTDVSISDFDVSARIRMYDDFIPHDDVADTDSLFYEATVSSGGTLLHIDEGIARMQTSTGANGRVRWFNANRPWTRNMKAVFETRLKWELTLVDKQGSMGFSEVASMYIPGVTTGDYVAVFCIDTTGNWFAKTRDGVGVVIGTETDTGVIPVLGTYQTFRIELDSGEVRFYINDVLEATHTTELPPAASAMASGFANQNTGSTNKQMDVDYALITADRV